MSATKVAEAIGNIRIPAQHIVDLLDGAIETTGDVGLASHFAANPAIRLRAVDMTQQVAIVSTLAQTMAPEMPFHHTVNGLCFSGGDPQLRKVFVCMIGMIRALPRIPDSSIPDSLWNERFNLIARCA